MSDTDTEVFESQATVEDSAGTPDTSSPDSVPGSEASREIGAEWQALQGERSVESGWTGRPEAESGDTADVGVPAADDPAAMRAAIESLGLDAEEVAEYASYIEENPQLRDHLYSFGSDDPEVNVEALGRNLDLIDRLRDGEDADVRAWQAESETAGLQLNDYARQLVDQAAEDPERAPVLLADFLLRGGDLAQVGDLVELGDEVHGPGQTIGFVQQMFAEMQRGVAQAEGEAASRQAAADLSAQWEAARAQDEYTAQMVAPAAALAERNGPAAELVRQALVADPGLFSSFASPEAAESELRRMEAVAVEQLRIDQENRRMIILSNGGNPDSPNPTDRYGRPIEVPDRVITPDLFKAPLSPAEQAAGFKLDMRQSIAADPVGDARNAKPSESKDPLAAEIGRKWKAQEAVRDMHAAWTGRESRRATR